MDIVIIKKALPVFSFPARFQVSVYLYWNYDSHLRASRVYATPNKHNSGFRQSSCKKAGADTIAFWGQEAREGQENAHKDTDFDTVQASWADQHPAPNAKHNLA